MLTLWRQYPRWGKDKLAILLRAAGPRVSTSMVSRILTRLQQRGVLVEPPRLALSHRTRRRLRHRPGAVRKPRFWPVAQPDDLVQLDTKQLRPARGVVLYHFSARDVTSRWDVVEVPPRANANTAARFLDTLLRRMPFPVRALQVDGGSEFAAEFEQACHERRLPLFVFPPRSPKLNGHVERAQRTHAEEFYEVAPSSWSLGTLNHQLQHWERIYNTVRPHQALSYSTLQQFLTQWKSHRKEPECH